MPSSRLRTGCQGSISVRVVVEVMEFEPSQTEPRGIGATKDAVAPSIDRKPELLGGRAGTRCPLEVKAVLVEVRGFEPLAPTLRT